jgi:phage/plasmid primase-like uncharacterized protein
MRFEDFARSHGLILRDIVPHKWVSTPTEDHPKKRNGRYKFIGDVGWVQNWATMDKPAMWKSKTPVQIDYTARTRAVEDRQEAANKAAAKAAWILHQSETLHHPYLEKKGFPEEVGNVWNKTLVIPMRVSGKIVGLQFIDEQGGKKFLNGQTTKGATFTIDAKGLPIFCEGYATGLSIRTVMKAIKIRYSIYICFSASNLECVARGIDGGIVIADNDPNLVGEKSAQATLKPYWISPTIGEDFNDFHNRVGLFQASQSLKKIVISHASTSKT